MFSLLYKFCLLNPVNDIYIIKLFMCIILQCIDKHIPLLCLQVSSLLSIIILLFTLFLKQVSRSIKYISFSGVCFLLMNHLVNSSKKFTISGYCILIAVCLCSVQAQWHHPVCMHQVRQEVHQQEVPRRTPGKFPQSNQYRCTYQYMCTHT